MLVPSPAFFPFARHDISQKNKKKQKQSSSYVYHSLSAFRGSLFIHWEKVSLNKKQIHLSRNRTFSLWCYLTTISRIFQSFLWSCSSSFPTGITKLECELVKWNHHENGSYSKQASSKPQISIWQARGSLSIWKSKREASVRLCGHN